MRNRVDAALSGMRNRLEAALSDRTAMLLIFGDAAERGQIAVAEMAEIGHRHGVPTLVDAAAERPDVPGGYFPGGVAVSRPWAPVFAEPRLYRTCGMCGGPWLY